MPVGAVPTDAVGIYELLRASRPPDHLWTNDDCLAIGLPPAFISADAWSAELTGAGGSTLTDPPAGTTIEGEPGDGRQAGASRPEVATSVSSQPGGATQQARRLNSANSGLDLSAAAGGAAVSDPVAPIHDDDLLATASIQSDKLQRLQDRAAEVASESFARIRLALGDVKYQRRLAELIAVLVEREKMRPTFRDSDYVVFSETQAMEHRQFADSWVAKLARRLGNPPLQDSRPSLATDPKAETREAAPTAAEPSTPARDSQSVIATTCFEEASSSAVESVFGTPTTAGSSAPIAEYSAPARTSQSVIPTMDSDGAAPTAARSLFLTYLDSAVSVVPEMYDNADADDRGPVPYGGRIHPVALRDKPTSLSGPDVHLVLVGSVMPTAPAAELGILESDLRYLVAALCAHPKIINCVFVQRYEAASASAYEVINIYFLGTPKYKGALRDVHRSRRYTQVHKLWPDYAYTLRPRLNEYLWRGHLRYLAANESFPAPGERGCDPRCPVVYLTVAGLPTWVDTYAHSYETLRRRIREILGPLNQSSALKHVWAQRRDCDDTLRVALSFPYALLPPDLRLGSERSTSNPESDKAAAAAAAAGQRISARLGSGS